MHYGYRIVEDMQDGLLEWMAEKGFATIEDFRGRSVPKVVDWNQLNLNYQIVARIHPDLCIGCQLCYTACWDAPINAFTSTALRPHRIPRARRP